MATTTRQRGGAIQVAAAAPDLRDVDPRSPEAVWWRAYLHHLRILRNGAIAWITALAGISVGVVTTFEGRYTTQAELEAFAEAEGIPAFEALLGRLVGLTTIEGAVLSRWGIFGILAAVWGMLAAARLLRGAEESGHLEPIRAGAISSRGLLGAVVAALLTTHLAFAVAIGLTHSAAGMDAATSWALGGAAGLVTACAAAASVLASQLAVTYRRVVGIVGAGFGLALGIRVLAAATGTPDWLWWATPFGWLSFLHELDGARTTVLVSYVVLLAALLGPAFLFARRDLHAARFGGGADTVGRPRRPVRSHIGLAVRVTAAPARVWGATVVVAAGAFGMLARDFGEAVVDMPTMVEMSAQMGWVGIDTPEGVVGWSFSFIAVILAVFAAGQASAIRDEEATWRIEHLLVRPLGRTRWLVTRILTSAGAIVALALVGGVASWIGTSLVGQSIAFTDALLAGINVVPIAWLTLGLGIGVFALLPRRTSALTYGLVLGLYLLDFVGGLLELPEWMLEFSPFRYLASVPAVDIALGPASVMVLVGLVAASVGVVVFRRRDLQEA